MTCGREPSRVLFAFDCPISAQPKFSMGGFRIGVIKDTHSKAELWFCSYILCAFVESCLHVCFLL